MTCLCFSDSHGVKRYMREALAKHSDCEVVFFLGDGVGDAEELSLSDTKRAWIFVRGNCDVFSIVCGGELKKLESITLQQLRIVLTHGDLYGAKYGFDGLCRLAENTNADVILYGHTHLATEKFMRLKDGRGVYFFNPGSIGGIHAEPSYGVLTLDKGKAIFSVMNFN